MAPSQGKLQEKAIAFLEGSFADEETARGYYPWGVFDYMKQAMVKEGLPEAEALKYRNHFNAVREYAIVVHDLFSHPDTYLSGKEIIVHARKIGHLLNLLSHIGDGTDPGHETAGMLQQVQNTFGEAARAFKRIDYSLNEKLKAHGTHIGDGLLRYADGLAKLQNVFDVTVGTALGALRERN